VNTNANDIVELLTQVGGNSKVVLHHHDYCDYVNVEIGSRSEPVALSGDDGAKLASGAKTALDHGIPLICHLNSTGAPPDSGVEALHGWGVAAKQLTKCSGVVPTIICVHQTAVSGSALLLGLVDLVIMVDQSYAYVSGPRMVQEFTGVPVDHETLGGSGKHAQTSGVASFVVSDEMEAEDLLEDILTLLPRNSACTPQPISTGDATDRKLTGIEKIIPELTTGSYDVRDILRETFDDGHITEVRREWATNLVTAFATIGGNTVGVVANQPQSLAGTLDIAASQKGARFVSFCDAFNLPIITFVDTPGFQPGKDLEWRGMIRHGAQLAFAYAQATVPRICVTLRKSYGGAYIVMDSKYMGNDLSLAWPSAEIAVMGAKGAVEILHRNVEKDERESLEADYENRLLNPYIAAERGSVDMIIEPAETRSKVFASLQPLLSKREKLQRRIHSNTPL
jgi:acetyl-CoA carboxylase carboxyltransferase component